MKRERHDATVISSSIALLQERFRELQRVKAIREEKEVTWRILALSDSQPEHNLMMMNSKRARLLFHPDHHVPGPSASLGVSLSSWPALKKSKHEEEDYVYRTSIKAPLLINLWPVSGAETSSLDTTTSSSNEFEDFHDCDADVDTSLHL